MIQKFQRANIILNMKTFQSKANRRVANSEQVWAGPWSCVCVLGGGVSPSEQVWIGPCCYT